MKESTKYNLVAVTLFALAFVMACLGALLHDVGVPSQATQAVLFVTAGVIGVVSLVMVLAGPAT